MMDPVRRSCRAAAPQPGRVVRTPRIHAIVVRLGSQQGERQMTHEDRPGSAARGVPAQLPCVVWDMSGVLYRYFTEVLHDLGVARRWPLGRIPLGATGDVADPEYARLQQGEIDDGAFVRTVVERLRAAGVDSDPINEIDWPAERRPGTWA